MSMETCIPAERIQWLTDFEARHGRPLRVLHVGNIANNAYLNAKFLRSVGVDAHVLSQDYFHIMACPEWEEIEITEPYGDDNAPSFSPTDVKTYRRPRWFIQASLQESVQLIRDNFVRSAIFSRDYLQQNSTEKIQEVFDHVQRLPGIVNDLLEEHRRRTRLSARMRVAARHAIQAVRQNPQFQAIFRYSGLRWLRSSLMYETIKTPGASVLQAPIPVQSVVSGALDAVSAHRDRAMCVVADFAAAFPDRRDKLTEEDVQPYLGSADLFRLAFEPYDIIQCYSTHPIFGYLAGNKPYVGYEHGTLRTFTMEDSPLHRLTALGYRKADHVFITNGDCLDYAKRLGITNYSPMIHLVDVEQHRQDHGIRPKEMKGRLNADVLLFCPLRHDWMIKGTDIYLRALPLIQARMSGRIVLVLVRWGSELEASRALIAELGCVDSVVWTPPLSRITLIKMMQAADVVLDQIALPHFGATAPQALAAGTPVISSYKPESTSWIVNEPAPILPAFSAEEVAQAVMLALTPEWRAKFDRRARHWVDVEHHQNRVVSEHLRVYRDILERRR